MSVLVAERVPNTYHSFCTELVQTHVNPGGLRTLLAVIAGFFFLARQGAGKQGYKLSDLHWKNLGITQTQAVVVIDLENICYSPQSNPRELYGAAVMKVWLKDIPPPSPLCWASVS